MAEMLAIRRSIQQREMLRNSHIIFVSDCEKAVRLVKYISKKQNDMNNLTLDCRVLLARNCEFQLRFERRTTNKIADCVAGEVRTSRLQLGPLILCNEPPEICKSMNNEELLRARVGMRGVTV